MKRKLLAGIYIFAFLFILQPSVKAQENKCQLTLIYASRMANIMDYSDKGGLPALAKLVNEAKAEKNKVILIHGGNALWPSPISAYDKGVHMVGLLNDLEPDLMAVGRRDFIFNEDELSLRGKSSIFPLITSNMKDEKNNPPLGVQETEDLYVDKHTLSFINLTSPKVASSYLQDRFRSTGTFNIVSELAQKKRKDGADLIIVLADFIPDNPEKVLKESLADIILINEFGESSFWEDGEKQLVIQGHEKDIIIFDLEIYDVLNPKESNFLVKNKKIIDISDLDGDVFMKDEVKTYKKSLKAMLEIPVGSLKYPFNTYRNALRTEENIFANLVADALRDYHKSDIAFINSGAIRGNREYPANYQITRSTIHTEMPIPDELMLLKLSGKELKEILEHSVSRVEYFHGGFLQVSGMSYAYSPSAPVGDRVKDVEIGGKKLDPHSDYLISVPSFLGNGGDGFKIMAEAQRLSPNVPTQAISELVQAYIVKNSPVETKLEGRIRVLDQ